MKSVRLLLAAGVLAGPLAGCAAPEPVLLRPALPADLFVCAPPPPKPPAMTGADLANRSNAWAAAYDICQCQLRLVQDVIRGALDRRGCRLRPRRIGGSRERAAAGQLRFGALNTRAVPPEAMLL